MNQLRMGTLLSYLQMALSVIIGLLYTPVMIRTLGKSEYGLYSTVASTISMLSILSLGFNSGYIRYYAKYKKTNEVNAIYNLNRHLFFIFCLIVVIALFLVIFIFFYL